MELNITTKKEEPLLSRTMLKATLEFENTTPSYAEATALLATNLKTDEKLIAIRHIYNSFGAKRAEVIAYVYTDENKKQFIEPKVKEKPAKIKDFRGTENQRHVSEFARAHSHSTDFLVKEKKAKEAKKE